MKNLDYTENNIRQVNYYNLIRKHLKQQYAKMSEAEVGALCREVVFAPNTYNTYIDEKATPITSVRENLADFIEKAEGNKNFIPYSLQENIADLIEQSECHTSSMNEYYRWVSFTADIVRQTSDGEVTEHDLAERKNFITMSYDREAEILLCLSLYEGTKDPKNKEKSAILRFKLARLRELRSIVKNTTSQARMKEKKKDLLQKYKDYCEKLLSKDAVYSPNINLNLAIDLETSDDLSIEYSNLAHLQETILLMMRLLEMPKTQNQRSENTATKEEVVKTPAPKTFETELTR